MKGLYWAYCHLIHVKHYSDQQFSVRFAEWFDEFYDRLLKKDNYNRYLTDMQGNGGSPDLFYEFMAGLLERSLKLTLNVIEGRAVE